MAITLTVQQLAAALRIGDSAEETAEAARLLSFATVAVERHLGAAFATTPEAVVNESVVRCCGYLFDMPNAGRGAGHADVLRNSGVLALLLPYRVHRAGVASGDPVLTPAQQTQRLIDESIAAHAALANVHHTPPAPAPPPPAAGGLRQTGSEAVTVATADQWVSTGLAYPTTDVFGVQVGEAPIVLGLTADLPDAGVVAGGDATTAIGMNLYALAASSVGGVIYFAATDTGTFTIRMFSHA